MAEIQFPISTAPGLNPTESGGRLINCYAEKAPEGSRSKVLWRRAPGLVTAFSLIAGAHRGAVLVGSILYIVSGDKAYAVTSAYGVTQLTGTVPGTGPAQMARNMAATPDVLILHSAGLSKINIGGASVADFSDPDLPATNSLCWIDGYFILTSEDGKAYQSGLNNTAFSSVDRTTAEADPDGLYRAIALGSDLLLMGLVSIEFYSNAGNPTGFAFNRGPVLPIGLKGRYAVAGWEPGFSDTLIYVANDNSVRRQDGYTPTRISNPDLERLIEAVDNPDDLKAFVFTAAGHQFWVLSSATWTWVWDNTSKAWHERASYGADRWRIGFSIYAFDLWLAFDRTGDSVFELSDRAKTEAGSPLVMRLRSMQDHRFPGRFWVKRASFDFVTGVGIAAGQDPIEANPVVLISYSDDGGRTWSTPRTFALGQQGQDVSIDWFRAGLTNRRGRVWDLLISDPVEAVFIGAAMDIEERAA